MNINSTPRRILYFLVIAGLTLLLIREYTYIHPYNPGMGFLGPRWTYISTKTITWWFLLISSLVLMTPLIRKQIIGFLGLTLFIAVSIRPIMQNKFPEETVYEFYTKRKKQLDAIVNKTKINDQTIINKEIKNAGFDKLIVKDSIYYFFFFDEDFMFGICKSQRQGLPKNTETFGRNIKFNKIENDWYELDY
jgi:hypothetical protein